MSLKGRVDSRRAEGSCGVFGASRGGEGSVCYCWKLLCILTWFLW